MIVQDKLLSMKELAGVLGRDRTYVWAMKRAGFAMPGGRARITDAIAWLEKHPTPRARNTTQRRATHARLISKKTRA